MSRPLLLVLALAVLATAHALHNSRYAFNQDDEIDARVVACLAPVPEGGFINPATHCRYQAEDNVREGAAKESLPDSVAYCLSHYWPKKIDSALVSTVKQCLVQSLAKPLPPALEPAYYSFRQLAEIDDRIKACLAPIPERPHASPVKDCRVDAMYKTEQYPHYPKESLTGFTISCLERKKFDASLVAAAQSCLVASLAEPLAN